MNFQMLKLVLEKAEEPEIKLPTSAGSSKKQKSSRKTSLSALLTMPKPLTAWNTINCGKFWRDGHTRPPDLPLEKSACRSRSSRTGHETIDWFQIGKGVSQGCILSPCLFNLYAECTLCEMLGWMKHKLKSRLQGKILVITDMHMAPPLWHKAERN